MNTAQYRAALLGVCLILLAPLLLVDVPPLGDYPNHLARLYILAHAGDAPSLARFYVPRWAIIPDLGIDLMGAVLLRALPVHVAGRVIVGVVLLLPVLGAVAYARALSGRWCVWALGAGLVAYNQAFLLGFLNFQAGMGLALLVAAFWVRGRELRPARTVIWTAVCCTGIFFCHLMGVIFLGFLLGAHELALLWRHKWNMRILLGRSVAAVAVFVGPLALYVASPLAHEGGEIIYLPANAKLLQLAAPLVNYLWPLDILSLILVMGLALWLWLARARHGTWGVHAGIIITLLAVAYLISPFAYAGVQNVDLRFVILAGFLLFCAFTPALPRWAMAGLGLLFLARMVLLVLVWHGHGATLASLRAVMAHIPPGSAVLSLPTPDPKPLGMDARILSNGARMDGHLPALIVIERAAWWPYLFDNASQQPVRTLPPYRDMALAAEGGSLGCIPPGYTHVLLMGAPMQATHLTLLTASEIAALYRVIGHGCERAP